MNKKSSLLTILCMCFSIYAAEPEQKNVVPSLSEVITSSPAFVASMQATDAKIKKFNQMKQAALFSAIDNGNLQVLKEALEAYKSPRIAIINTARDTRDLSLLAHALVIQAPLEIIEYLIKEGADVAFTEPGYEGLNSDGQPRWYGGGDLLYLLLNESRSARAWTNEAAKWGLIEKDAEFGEEEYLFQVIKLLIHNGFKLYSSMWQYDMGNVVVDIIRPSYQAMCTVPRDKHSLSYEMVPTLSAPLIADIDPRMKKITELIRVNTPVYTNTSNDEYLYNSLLPRGVFFEQCFYEWTTPLITAINLDRSEEEIKDLLDAGADPNQKSPNVLMCVFGRDALDTIALGYHRRERDNKKTLDLLKLLIKYGAKDDEALEGALFTAIVRSDEEMVLYLLGQHVRPNFLHPGISGIVCAALIDEAVNNNKYSILKRLLEYNIIDVNMQFCTGYSEPKLTNFLNTAVEIGNIPLTSFLLKYGAQQIPNQDGFSPLSVALESENKELVKILLDYGANVRDDYLLSLFYKCPYRSDTFKECVGLIFDYMVEKKLSTPLIKAVFLDDFAAVDRLLKSGATQDPDIYGKVPLRWALQRGDKKIIKNLLDHNPSINKDLLDFASQDTISFYDGLSENYNKKMNECKQLVRDFLVLHPFDIPFEFGELSVENFENLILENGENENDE